MSFYPIIALACLVFIGLYLWMVGSYDAALLVGGCALFMTVLAVVVERDL